MKTSHAVGALVGLQLLLVGLYFAVEGSRSSPTPFPVEVLDEVAPPLAVERGATPTPIPTEPHLVHFWATWCAPCLEELPSLLAATQATGVPLLALTDEPWPAVERYFQGQVPQGIVRDPNGEAAAAWRVSGLPDTFVVREGRVVGRLGGPQDWQTPEARAFLRTLVR